MEYRSIAHILLEYLAESGPFIIDTLIPPHHKSRLARALLGLDGRRYVSRASAKHSYSSILNRLKREGLVVRSGPRSKAAWRITPKGHTNLQKREKRERKSVRRLTYDTLPPEDGTVRLITFDIPEKQRAKRDWLRMELLACGYALLQRSVFIGKRPLPHALLELMETLQLSAYVHIVGIDKQGTLRKKN
ncbi:MAG: hypothetical protein Greene071436_226 [Parcubacteria group bacterium Greene0714_36]|nr:MAG: hypothetical protein Greene071436_226 [Parcubacteria group bacterium Greene0714_36]